MRCTRRFRAAHRRNLTDILPVGSAPYGRKVKARALAPDIGNMPLQLVPSAAETAWLFVRAGDSVRITRSALPDGGYRLLVEGPRDAEEILHFSDLVLCVEKQMDLEYTLLVRGFHLERLTPDRRRQDLPPPAVERRRRRR